MTTLLPRLEYAGDSAARVAADPELSSGYDSIPASALQLDPDRESGMKPMCKHPRVQIVAREEDAEYVECKECGEVFESSEFKDMAIEENTPAEEEA